MENIGTVAEWLGIVAAVGIGITGLLTARSADQRAKKSNELAEIANSTAADALRQAEEANRIADLANDLSKNANSLAERKFAQETETHAVEWQLQWNEDSISGPILVNLGPDAAHQVRISVVREHLAQHSEGPVDVDAFASEPVPGLDELRKGRSDTLAARGRTFMSMGQVLPHHRAIKFQVRIHWRTGLDSPRECVLDAQALYQPSTGSGFLL